MFQARTRGREKRFDELRFAELAEESKSVAPNIFVWMLKVVSDSIAIHRRQCYQSAPPGPNNIESGSLPHKDHFLLELSIRIVLGADFVVEIEEFLQRLALGGHNKANDVHQ